MIPPRNIPQQQDPIAVEEMMGAGMTDHHLNHTRSSLKDERPSVMDPPKNIPDDEITAMMDQRMPSPHQKVIMEGTVVNATMMDGGAHVEVSDGRKSILVFIAGTLIIERDMPIAVIAHMDQRTGSVLKVTLSQIRGGE